MVVKNNAKNLSTGGAGRNQAAKAKQEFAAAKLRGSSHVPEAGVWKGKAQKQIGKRTVDPFKSVETQAKAEKKLAKEMAALAAKNAVIMNQPHPESMPVAEHALAMGEGRYDFAYLQKEVKRLTGVELAKKPGPNATIGVVVPDHGFWASETTHAVKVFEAMGYKLENIIPYTMLGGKPKMLDVSAIEGFRDEPRNAIEVTAGDAMLANQFRDPNSRYGKWLEGARSLNELVPPAPPQASGIGKAGKVRANYERDLAKGLNEMRKHDALVLTGGSGAFFFNGADNLEKVIALAASTNKPVGAVCYGVGALANAKDPKTQRYVVEGQVLAGHPEKLEWRFGTGFKTGHGEAEWSPPLGTSPIRLERAVKEHTGKNGGLISVSQTQTSVKSGNFFTGESTQDGYAMAVAMMAHMFGNAPLPERMVFAGVEAGREPKKSDFVR